MRNPFNNMQLKTQEEMLVLLRRTHLALPIIDSDYMPDDLCEKKKELEDLLLKYIWKWGREIVEKKKKRK